MRHHTPAPKPYLIIFAILVFVSTTVAHAQVYDSAAPIFTLSLVNQDPQPARAGNIVELRLQLENNGNAAANNVIVEMKPKYPFTNAPGYEESKTVGTLKAGVHGADAPTLKFDTLVDREATAGQYQLEFDVYEQGSATMKVVNVDIDVEASQSAEIIYIDKVELVPGHITPLEFTINNVGSSPLRDVTFNWKSPDGIILPVSSDDTRYIKYIGVGESTTLQYQVIASGNAVPDLYKLDLSLTYDEATNGSKTQINTAAGVYVGGQTDFDVAYSGSASGETSFSISNIGSVSANSVTGCIPDQPGWTVSGSNSVIIGNLNEGDYTIASFKLSASGGRTTQYSGTGRPRTTAQAPAPANSSSSNINVDVVYTDSRGNRQTVTRAVPIDPASLRQGSLTAGTPTRTSSSTNWTTYGLILLLVLAIIGYLRYRSVRKAHPKKSRLDAVKGMFKR